MSAPPTKILVVDDEAHTAASIRAALGAGYQVESVSDGQEAFDILKDKDRGFDILIADHMMPVWAGSELLKRLQIAGFRGKCIVISGYMSQQVEAIYHGLGVEHIIPKPFDLEQLRSAVAASARAIKEQNG